MTKNARIKEVEIRTENFKEIPEDSAAADVFCFRAKGTFSVLF